MNRALLIRLLAVPVLLAAAIPAAAQSRCTRADLQAAVDAYVAAQKTGNVASLPMAPSAKYIENTLDTPLDKGIVARALKIDFNRSIFDTTICETFTEVIVTDPAHPYVLGVRTRVTGSRIAELETLVTDADDWLFNAGNYLKYSPTEDWSPIPPGKRDTRAVLIAAANAYFDVFDNPKVKVPWGVPCNRLEGGIRTGKGAPDDSCNVGVPAEGGMKLTDRRFIADPEMGAVVGFIRWPTTVPDSHLFRIENGRIRFVHSLTVCTVPNCGFPALPPRSPPASGN
jgi:hypothetical protein